VKKKVMGEKEKGGEGGRKREQMEKDEVHRYI